MIIGRSKSIFWQNRSWTNHSRFSKVPNGSRHWWIRVGQFLSSRSVDRQIGLTLKDNFWKISIWNFKKPTPTDFSLFTPIVNVFLQKLIVIWNWLVLGKYQIKKKKKRKQKFGEFKHYRCDWTIITKLEGIYYLNYLNVDI